MSDNIANGCPQTVDNRQTVCGFWSWWAHRAGLPLRSFVLFFPSFDWLLENGKKKILKKGKRKKRKSVLLHTPQITKATSTQELDPRPLTNNDHPSVLPFEMYSIEPGEPPSRSLSWKPLGFLSHITRRTNRDRFPLSLWEVWFWSTIGVPIPALIGPPQQCACNSFHNVEKKKKITVLVKECFRAVLLKPVEGMRDRWAG